MVTVLLHPLNIFIVGLGAGFLIPLFYRLGSTWVAAVFFLSIAAMTLISGHAVLTLLLGGAPFEIFTGGTKPPYAINLRMGIGESIVAFCLNLTALMGAVYVVREKYGVLLLYLLLVMGIQGMVMTRDLFNLFVFLEIVSVATYGLLSLGTTVAALSASFKFLMATIVASTFYLLGTMLLYAVTGMLNIDDLIASRTTIEGPIGFAALMLLLGCLLLELKPFPANGWGLDVYETAQSGVAALIATGVSAGVFFALYNLFPLFEDHAHVIAILGAITFVVSNLIGLAQTKTQRLLGYSSVGQMGLVSMALALLYVFDAKASIPLVVGGLFVNHLLAKAGLFWLAGSVGKENINDWSVLADKRAIFVFAVLLCAIAGLPPFPAFWAKWQLIFALASGGGYVWIALVLLGSLLEAAYLFRWFGQSLHCATDGSASRRDLLGLLPIYGAVFLLVVFGYGAARAAGLASLWVVVPLGAGAGVWLVDRLPGRAKAALVFVLLALDGYWITRDMSGINYLFAVLLFAGSLTLTIACLYRGDERPGFYPLLAVLLLSLSGLPHASTSLEFFFLFELVTLSSYFLIGQRREAEADAFSYLVFSLAAGYFVLAGFALAHEATGSEVLTSLLTSGPDTGAIFVLLASGFLIKAGAIGVHVWLPGAYAEAEDDLSAMLSAVVSKVPIFGLLVGSYAAIHSEANLSLAHGLAWIGMLTAVAGAMLAVQQDDVKRMLAYSSMSQLGYIMTAIALMSHLGWVTAFYLTANHLMTKGILFLVAAAIILRTGVRSLADLGGLARSMPFTFGAAAIGIVAMSGLPPLAGFGGKWLLLSAMIEKGWYGLIAMVLLATFVGFLYMARFVQAIFLDAPKVARGAVAEAPPALLVSQYLLILGILVMSFFPRLLIVPISQAIDPYFASTLVWEGMPLEEIYGYWNPVPAMAVAVAVSALLFGVLWLLWSTRAKRVDAAGAPHRSLGFYAYYKPALTRLTPPLAATFWSAIAAGARALADTTRRVYTGDGQTYTLYVFYYFIVLYVACGGFGKF
jgi:formate hydrogenlyase subunit 3/multisubunit Na+/H+ antiporter MnhD subunit